MNEKPRTRVSKRLSRHLRHEPASLDLVLDPAGVGRGPAEALRTHGFAVTRAELDEVVAHNRKQRFSFDETGTRIRANRGHRVEVDPGPRFSTRARRR